MLFGVCFAGLVVLGRQANLAAKIKLDDSVEEVQELLGTPTKIFATTREMRNSELWGMSYSFRKTDRTENYENVRKLPPIPHEALWFEYYSSGSLVYVDEEGKVTHVFWAGT